MLLFLGQNQPGLLVWVCFWVLQQIYFQCLNIYRTWIPLNPALFPHLGWVCASVVVLRREYVNTYVCVCVRVCENECATVCVPTSALHPLLPKAPTREPAACAGPSPPRASFCCPLTSACCSQEYQPARCAARRILSWLWMEHCRCDLAAGTPGSRGQQAAVFLANLSWSSGRQLGPL